MNRERFLPIWNSVCVVLFIFFIVSFFHATGDFLGKATLVGADFLSIAAWYGAYELVKMKIPMWLKIIAFIFIAYFVLAPVYINIRIWL